ncbi:mitochondrial import receptor subunit TOM34 [Alligator mississippiensis]|uniref:Mitochondrial import receptor subunit TOM34 n=1 Tax=Alligator mississippiensis TaxID=8496 RepID=A0A151NZJ2_ALLMI|nr:mitochondrial import receptor subunit TOM34 [Alligator mississippiensis]KYO42163.1 mitochondrial import receptor subunit TOM34 [Alligator mississippiensis]
MAPEPRVAALRSAGNEQFRSGQYGQAAALYSRALALLEAAGEKDAEEMSVLHSNRAACYLKDGNCSLCVKDCTVALDLVPFGIKPLLRRAAAYEALERYQLAYVDYKTVLQIDCTVQAAHDGVNRMTKALLEKDGPEWRQKLPRIPSVPVSAQRRWDFPHSGSQEAAPRTKPNETAPLGKEVPTAAAIERAKTLKEEGNELVRKGNHKKAIEKYRESLKLNQESSTYTNRALCYLSLKQYKETIQDCTEALKLDAKNIKAFYRRAQAFKELKDYKSSIADVSSLLKIEPKNTAAQKLLKELNRV